MDHTFLAGVGEHDDEVSDEGLLDVHDEELLVASSYSWIETDSELSGSSFSGDSSLASDDDSAFCSWQKEVEDVDVQFVGSSDKEVHLLGFWNGLTPTQLITTKILTF